MHQNILEKRGTIRLLILLLPLFLLNPASSYSQGSCSSVNFTSDIQNTCAPGLINFSATGAPVGSEYYWNFSNGFLKASDTVFKSFSGSGNYTIKLLVKLPNGAFCDTIIKPNYITILPSPSPKVHATTQVLCNGPGNVTFTDSTPNVVSREWTIDGFYYPNGSQTIPHNFTSLGNKALTLKVKNTYGCIGIFTQPDYVKVFKDFGVDFCVNVTKNGNTMSATFTPELTPNGQTVKTYAWSFPGGSPSTSSQANPTISYTYSPNLSEKVKLTITTTTGCKYSLERDDFIKNFIKVSKDTLCMGDTVTVISNANNGGRGFFSWDFLNAELKEQTQTTFTIKHTSPGNKRVDVGYKYSQDGCLNRVRYDNLFLVKGPMAQLSSSDRYQCDTPATIHFINQSQEPAGNTTYEWRFYDSAGVLVPNSKIGPIPKKDTAYTFLKKGVYDVELTATSSNGCSHTNRYEKFIRIGKPVAEFASDKLVSCTKDIVSLNDSTKPEAPVSNPYTYQWTVQHADSNNVKNTFSVRNPQFVPRVPGKYHVMLIVKNSPTCVDTMLKNNYLTINGVDAEIDLDKSLACKGETVHLKARIKSVYPLSSADSLIYTWTSTPDLDVVLSQPDSLSTDMFLPSPGCYTPTIKISDNYECELAVRKIPGTCVGTIPLFNMDQLYCANLPIQLKDSSALAPEEWNWSTDPPSSTFLPSPHDTNPQVIFYQDTCYNLMLVTGKLIDNAMCYDTTSQLICVSAPKADFETPDTLKYCAPVAVQFISQSENALTYIWDFGDGTFLETTNENPFHTYEQNNVAGFEVKLVAINAKECRDSVIKTKHIKVLGPEPGFSLDNDVACEQLEVNFVNKSTNTVSFIFDYGDGSLPDSNQLKKHVYQLPLGVADSGIFLPTLIARDASNCTSTFTDTVLLYPRPIPDFTADSSSGCPPFTVQFHDQSIAAIDWQWDLNGDGVIDSTGPDPTYTYPSIDSIDITLYIIGKGGCRDSLTIQDFIKVLPVPDSKFVLSADRGCDTLEVSFVNESQFFTDFTMDYGDGTLPVENVLKPHTYKFDYNSGLDSMIFIPTLTVKNAAGCAVTHQDTIIIFPNPDATFTWDTTSGCEPLRVQFTGPSGNLKYRWDFEKDGIVDANIPNPLHPFSNGLYTVVLEVETVHGCISRQTETRLIDVRESPAANFIYTDTALCSGDSVTFHDQSYSAYRLTTFGWNFGDPKTSDDTSTLRNPDPYHYFDPGTYTVTLAIADEFGCKDTVVVPNLVLVKDTSAPAINDLMYVTVQRNSLNQGDSNHVEVVWNKSPLDDFGEYRLLRSIDATNPYYVSDDINETDYIDSINTDPTSKSYCYALQVVDECGNISAISGDHCSIVLNAYTQGPSQNLLSWSPYKGWSNVVRYEIYRAIGNDPYELINTVPGTERSYLDENLCDTAYCYYFQAISPTGLASGSNYACNRAPYEYQEKPLELYVATVADSFSTFITWEPGTQRNINRYIIDRYTGWYGWEDEYDESRNTYYYDHRVRVNEEPYRYRISVEDACGYISPLSNEATSIYLQAGIIVQNGVYQVELKWNPYEEWLSGVNQYIVQLQQPDGSFKTIGMTDGLTNSFIDTGLHLEIESAWCYRVKAVEGFIDADTSVSNTACTIYPSSLYIPSAFSPNGDHINDVFHVSPISIYRLTGQKPLEYSLKIYDRWGQLLYETNDWQKGWDGLYNGQPAQQGVYVYIVKGVGYDSKDHVLRGIVTLLR